MKRRTSKNTHPQFANGQEDSRESKRKAEERLARRMRRARTEEEIEAITTFLLHEELCIGEFEQWARRLHSLEIELMRVNGEQWESDYVLYNL